MNKEKFDKLSRRAQRVLLAKDALEHIKTKALIPAHHGYFRYWNGSMAAVRESSAQKLLKLLQKEKNECYVCAKGALFCSYILEFNNYPSSDLFYNVRANPEMVAIFGDVLWAVIEALYEGWSFDSYGRTYKGELDFETAQRLKRQLYNHAERTWSLPALLNNLIRNNGTLNYNGVIFGA